MLYTALTSFRDTPSTECQHSIYFEAEDRQDAAKGVWAWAKGRHVCMPEMFSACLAIKIWQFAPQPIVKGQLGGSTGAMIYEWKYDWPGAEGMML